MNRREAILVRRKAEDQPADTQRTGGYSPPGAQRQKHRKSELNGKLCVAAHLPILQCNREDDHYNPRIAQEMDNELS